MLLINNSSVWKPAYEVLWCILVFFYSIDGIYLLWVARFNYDTPYPECTYYACRSHTYRWCSQANDRNVVTRWQLQLFHSISLRQICYQEQAKQLHVHPHCWRGDFEILQNTPGSLSRRRHEKDDPGSEEASSVFFRPVWPDREWAETLSLARFNTPQLCCVHTISFDFLSLKVYF